MWTVREWDDQEGTTYTDFPTYAEAKRYFDDMVTLTITEWKREGWKKEEIKEALADILIGNNKWMDWQYEMEIVKV